VRVLVTGATSGVGEAVAQALAGHGHDVIVHGRDQGKCARVVGAIESSGGRACAEVCDLASLSEVAAMATRLAKGAVDAVVNNAGVWLNERVQTRDGYEATWQINHLAPFLLTTMLLPGLLERPDARVINLSSSGHRAGSIDFEDVNLERSFTGMRAYCQSKLANVLFTQELARQTSGTSLVTHALHPGAVQTKLLAATGFKPPAMSAAQSAHNCVALAVGPSARDSSGHYFAEGKQTPAVTTDVVLAARLWSLSERQVAAHRL
jgi:NAD(P)-dependent dehydrogenase (short-subunit alcohol dehydrogenase family)